MNFNKMAGNVGGQAIDAASGAAVGQAAGALQEHTGYEMSEDQTNAFSGAIGGAAQDAAGFGGNDATNWNAGGAQAQAAFG